jgi:SH3-like domain-containing protein
MPDARRSTVPRWLAAVLAMFLILGAARLASAADVVAVAQDASLRASKGEKGAVLLKLKAGQKVRVLAREGRWVKVQVKGKTGWLTRTQVDGEAPAPEQPAAEADDKDKGKDKDGKGRKAEGWGTVGAADGDAVGGDAVARKAPVGKIRVGDEVVFLRKTAVYERPSAKADLAFNAKKGEKMTVVSLDAEWVRVQDDDGNKGWVEAAELRADGGAAPERDERDDRGDARRADEERRRAQEDERRRDEEDRKRREDEDKKRADDKKRRDEEDRKRRADEDRRRRDADEDRRADDDDAEEDEDDRRAAADDDDDRRDRDRDDRDDEAARDDDARASSGGGFFGGGASGFVVRDRWQGKGKMGYWARADLGFLMRSQRYESDGDGLRANYDFSNTAPILALEVGIQRDMGWLILALDLSYTQTIGGGEISVASDDMVSDETLAWKYQELQTRLHGWYEVHRGTGLALGAHLGYRRAAITVANGMASRLPSERLAGFLVGVGVDAPYLSKWIDVGLSWSLLVAPTLTQTAGLADGAKNDAVGWMGEVHVNYHFKRRINLQVAYELHNEGAAFAGPNEREPSAEGAKRVDMQHQIMVGAQFLF